MSGPRGHKNVFTVHMPSSSAGSLILRACCPTGAVRAMPFEEGDFVLIDYTLKVKETGQVIDTTLEEVAKKTGLQQAGETFEPMLVVIGAGWVLEGLEKRLRDMDVGQEATIELPPEEAYGPRDPEKVVRLLARRLSEKGVRLRVGERVRTELIRELLPERLRSKISRPWGIIRAVGSGRVHVDFNHPLAGKTLIYEVAVRRKIEDPVEKVRALIHRRLPLVSAEGFEIEMGEKEVVIKVPEEAFYVEGIQLVKRGVANDVMRFFPGVELVRFVEEFKKASA